MTSVENHVYPRVRALERGLELISALSELGWATPGQLAKCTGIHRATVYRLLSTLELNEYVYCRQSDNSYTLTRRFSYIADGIKDEDRLAQVVSPHLGHLLSQIQWPSDFVTFSSGRLIIRESTHRFSPMSVNRGMVGKSRPLLNSALGISFLSALSDESREQIIDLAELAGDESVKIDNRESVMNRILIARTRGYAESTGETQHNISAIALPVCCQGRVLGAVNIMFFKRALTPLKAAELYLEHLRHCVSSIENELQSFPLGEHTGWMRRRD